MERLNDFGTDLTSRYHKARYEFASRFCNGKSVIDIACGSGAGTRLLGSVSNHVIGIDPYLASGVGTECLRKGYIETLSPASCDVVVCFETIEHTISLDLSLRMLASALKDGGLLILSFPNGWGETEFHLHNTDEHLVSLVEKYFAIREFYGQNRKSHIEPVKTAINKLAQFENIILVATKVADMGVWLTYDERFALIYEECKRRQTQKVRGLGFRVGVLPARLRTKCKRVFGV